ncbi:NucA/NucB deoxyribonuclease domain-containing protein [Saccharothrix deserti]|uniref:NucA/NucB deoxyribonuclease domain-containing protein n=1 Tax=Saccharothrix deserti TaxID=2593674 RepID=UPI00131E540C|nr:NucA/NucB deoxyribonuclease domain-containing protein [Saccharothrix deserti]
MAKTRSTGLLPVLVLGAVVILFGPTLLDNVQDAVSELGSSVEPSYVVAPAVKPRTDRCTADQLLKERQCDDLKVVLLSAEKMPYITRNIQLAWAEGKPAILHKDAPGTDQTKRNTVCGSGVFTKTFPDGSCDEYAFASTVEGGSFATVRTEEVPLREQNCQGGTLRQEYRRANIAQGDAFIVVITNPGKIATSAYAGSDTAEDQSCTS